MRKIKALFIDAVWIACTVWGLYCLYLLLGGVLHWLFKASY